MIKLREVKQLTKGHIARKRQRLDLNSNLTSNTFLLITIFYCFPSGLMSEWAGGRKGMPPSISSGFKKTSWGPSFLGEVWASRLLVLGHLEKVYAPHNIVRLIFHSGAPPASPEGSSMLGVQDLGRPSQGLLSWDSPYQFRQLERWTKTFPWAQGVISQLWFLRDHWVTMYRCTSSLSEHWQQIACEPSAWEFLGARESPPRAHP